MKYRFTPSEQTSLIESTSTPKSRYFGTYTLAESCWVPSFFPQPASSPSGSMYVWGSLPTPDQVAGMNSGVGAGDIAVDDVVVARSADMPAEVAATTPLFIPAT